MKKWRYEVRVERQVAEEPYRSVFSEIVWALQRELRNADAASIVFDRASCNYICYLIGSEDRAALLWRPQSLPRDIREWSDDEVIRIMVANAAIRVQPDLRAPLEADEMLVSVNTDDPRQLVIRVSKPVPAKAP